MIMILRFIIVFLMKETLQCNARKWETIFDRDHSGNRQSFLHQIVTEKRKENGDSSPVQTTEDREVDDSIFDRHNDNPFERDVNYSVVTTEPPTATPVVQASVTPTLESSLGPSQVPSLAPSTSQLPSTVVIESSSVPSAIPTTLTSPSDSPSQVPSPFPSNVPSNGQTPSGTNSTQAAPVFPSREPSTIASPFPLRNDLCAAATSLEINGLPLVGSTVNATTTWLNQDLIYSFVGNGRRIRVSTCFEETEVAHNFRILNGGCTSSWLSGVVSTDPTCTGIANAAAFEFDSVNGRLYPIVVGARVSGQNGNFAIQVTDYVNPSNDYCSAPVSLEINGPPVVGSTVNATTTWLNQDVIYSFVGNGRRIRVSTCFEETEVAHNFRILNGGCSSSWLSGVVATDPTCAGTANAAAFEFDSVNGRLYPIVVGARVSGQNGIFAIQVTDYVNPSNDYCSAPASLAINGPPAIGSTVNATTTWLNQDVIYSFVGNGRRIRVSTCFEETEVAHNFRILNGGCSSSWLSGVVATDPTCAGTANAAAFEFDSVNERLYPIVVGARVSGQNGIFAIQVTDYVNPVNDVCGAALPLEINGPPVVGSTVNATTTWLNQDVIYSFVGNGQRIRVSTCFEATEVAHNFRILNGGCTSSWLSGVVSSDPTCAGTANAAMMEFDSVDGRLYPIVVGARVSQEIGNFAIQVLEADVVGQPSCDDTTPLSANGLPRNVSVSTSDTGSTSFSVLGNGLEFDLTICSSAGTDYAGFVVHRSGISSTQYVSKTGETNGRCDPNEVESTVTWTSADGSTYLISVFARQELVEDGSFEISVAATGRALFEEEEIPAPPPGPCI